MRNASLLAFVLATAGPLGAQTSLSIYSDGRVVVRRTLAQPMVKGRNTVTLDVAGVDPGTVFSPDSSVAVVSATARPATNREQALARAVGTTLSFVRMKGDTVRATVLRTDPPQFRLADGRVLMVEPGEPLFPDELVRTSPQLSIVLDASRARPSTDIAYVGEGAEWSAGYAVLIEGAQAVVLGRATIVTQSFAVDSAEVQLVAGTIGRARRGPPVPMAMAARADMLASKEVSEAAVGEMHVYTLPARMTLERAVPTTTALFPAARTAAALELIVPGELPLRGYPGSTAGGAEPDRVPVEVWYTLKRTRGTAFGDRPLPGGVVQIFQRDSGGRVQLIGEATSDHSAAGRDLRVQAGDAFDITALRVQTDYAQEPLPPVRKGFPMRQRVTASYRVTLSNAKPDPVSVDVRETHDGTWLVVTSSVPGEKLSAKEVRFRVAVPARGDATLTYTVQVDS